MGNAQDEMDALKAQVAALTSRVYQLEPNAGVGPEARPPAAPPAPPRAGAIPRPSDQTMSGASDARPSGPTARQPLTQPQQTLLSASAREDANLEKKIGQYWLNRIGIVAILVGVSYFLKYAFENNWIGPGGRIAIGLLAGIGLVIWSERFRSRGYKAFSYSLKAVGIGTLYLSLWGAFQVYHLIPAGVAFAAMVIVTGATIALALSQDAELLQVIS
jgi:uncharacterized membrane protein